MKTISYSALAKRNRTHHRRVAELTRGSEAMQKALAKRKKYFSELTRLPFFRELIKKRKELAIQIDGQVEKCQLCLVGIKNVNVVLPEILLASIPTKMAFMIDPRGRIRFFCKTTHPNEKNPQWAEMRGFINQRLSKTPTVLTKERPIHHGRDFAEFNEMKSTLEKHEKEIDFQDNGTIRDILSVQKVL
ncbi:MAG: hypothetical protein WCW44_06495 [archaeon]|jgi:hypothetical protein